MSDALVVLSTNRILLWTFVGKTNSRLFASLPTLLCNSALKVSVTWIRSEGVRFGLFLKKKENILIYISFDLTFCLCESIFCLAASIAAAVTPCLTAGGAACGGGAIGGGGGISDGGGAINHVIIHANDIILLTWFWYWSWWGCYGFWSDQTFIIFWMGRKTWMNIIDSIVGTQVTRKFISHMTTRSLTTWSHTDNHFWYIL